MDPQEWKKECERVAPLLVVKLKSGGTSFEVEAQERAHRRKKTLQHLKVVSEFRQSNIPLLMESMCEHWSQQLQWIKTQEEKLTQQNNELIEDFRVVQDKRRTLVADLRERTAAIDQSLGSLEQLEHETQEANKKIE